MNQSYIEATTLSDSISTLLFFLYLYHSTKAVWKKNVLDHILHVWSLWSSKFHDLVIAYMHVQ